MTPREAKTPNGPLHRIGRAPEPLAWAEWRYVGEGRFDPTKRPASLRVLYVAEQRLACFVETLAKWRPRLDLLARLGALPTGDVRDERLRDAAGMIPNTWHLDRRMATLRLLAGQRWLDLREHQTRETLRLRLARRLRSLGYADLELGDAMGRDRRLTKSIAQFAVTEGFQGIAYKSRFDHAFDCWALFEGAEFRQLADEPIAPDDPDLIEAARRLGLRLEP